MRKAMEICGQIHSVSPVGNVTDESEACPKHWFVALVQMNCEKTANKKLQLLNFETFLPIQIEMHQWSDRRKKVERVVIPMMIFVKLTTKELEKVRNLSFIYRFLTASGEHKPAIIPDEQIEQFKFMLGNADSEITMEPLTIRKGDKVRVRRGSLRGLVGYASVDSDGNSKIMIVIDCLGCASVSISAKDLEHVK